MAKPTIKTTTIEQFLEAFTGRSSAIKSDRCVKSPIGCGGLAVEFDDELSRKEFTISGLCQKCQNDIFGRDN